MDVDEDVFEMAAAGTEAAAHAPGSSSSATYTASAYVPPTAEERAQYEAAATRDFLAYLMKKANITEEQAAGYRVHLNYNAVAHRRTPHAPYTVAYVGPKGEFLQVRGDVVTAIKQSFAAGGGGARRPREDIYAAAGDAYDAVSAQLPAVVDGIRVLSFGHVDPLNCLFHSPVEIYPVGYRAEVSATCSRPFLRALGLGDAAELQVRPWPFIDASLLARALSLRHVSPCARHSRGWPRGLSLAA